MSLYLYCLRESVQTPRAIKAAAVAGKGRVTIRNFDGIEAVVSEIDPDNFVEMQKKAQEDVRWIKKKALVHEMVVEEAMGKNLMDRNSQSVRLSFRAQRGISSEGITAKEILRSAQDDNMLVVAPFSAADLIPVIPVKFGVIFNTAERLAEVLVREGKAIKAAFNRIRGKQEWSVKIFLKDTLKFKEQISRETATLCEKSKKLTELPAGLAYFMETEFNEELERECSRELDKEAHTAFAQLKSEAAEAVVVKLLGKELTGRNERMALNSAFLVPQSQLTQFRNAVAELSAQLMPKGFLVEQSGPWPAYHFTEFAHD